ncbi:MAG: 4'-phosphopantetheinyl transferase superfamily protein [Gammaproteobacteria bacterium]|nr:4'-phosphopantetheinyl transferase superfamily protein [Gammaproteobacteria bacterium]
MDCENATVSLYAWRLETHLSDDLALLSNEETHRYRNFKQPLAAMRYAAARAGLRLRLGEHLNDNPAALQIRHTPLGKPFLSHFTHCHFSLSHCGDNAVLAVADVPVGVDLEALPKRDWQGLAQHVLSDEELDHLRTQPMANQSRCLIEYWTAKESVMKACGLGLQLPVKLIQISSDFRQVILPPDVAKQVGDQWQITLKNHGTDKVLSVCVLSEAHRGFVNVNTHGAK